MTNAALLAAADEGRVNVSPSLVVIKPAGRLKQLRDPDMVKLMPYWEYVWADSRVPMNRRPEHVALNGLILAWDDPWWNVYFPPNDWLCSCGVRGCTRSRLRRLGKSGPDKAPDIVRKPHTHRATGVTVDLPEGVGYGWDHMPGDLWDRGLVPSALIDEGGGLIHEGRHVVVIDEPSPLEDLVAAARPFSAQPMAQGLLPEDYVRGFLNPFGPISGAPSCGRTRPERGCRSRTGFSGIGPACGRSASAGARCSRR